MPVYETDALILRTYRLAEADRIVVFLTRDRGKKRGVAAGARRQRSRFTGALEPLTWAGVAYFEKERRELVRINYVEPRRSPLAAPDPDALSYVGYFAELMDEWAQDGDPNEKLYRLGAAVVEALAQGAPMDRVARYFEYWLLRLQGVYPSLATCQRCGDDLADGARLTPRDRVFVCRRCGADTGGPGLSGPALAFLRRGAGLPPDRLDVLELPPRAARELETAHAALITTHLEKELRSPRVLREMRT